MARLLLFVCRPALLSEEEAAGWVRDQAVPLAALPEVERVELTRLRAPAALGGTDCEWLIEMQCEDEEHAALAARAPACRALVGDLRLLGMRPRLAVAGGGEPVREARWH